MDKKRTRMVSTIPRYENHDEGRAWTLTNSERSAAACPLRHFFRYTEGLRSTEDSRPLRFGTAVHTILQKIFEVFALEHTGADTGADCTLRPDLVEGWIEEVATAWRTEEALVRTMDSEEMEDDIQAVGHAIRGWVITYGDKPWAEYEVLAVERVCRAPILHPTTGAPLRSKMLIIEDGQKLRPARGGESDEARLVQWPWIYLGTIDVILRHRRTGTIWLMDHKTSGDPRGFLRDIVADPQSAGYVWMVETAIRAGDLEDLGVGRDAKVAGFVFNVMSSSKQRPPALLKKGGLSLAKAICPSWLWHETILKYGLNPDDYAEHLDVVRSTVDTKLYIAEWASIGREDRERFRREVYADAVRISGLYREGARSRGALDLALSHPRVPVCRLPGGFCSFKGPCAQDGPEARADYLVSSGVFWAPPATPTTPPAPSDPF
jgi:hypothetical protein